MPSQTNMPQINLGARLLIARKLRRQGLCKIWASQERRRSVTGVTIATERPNTIVPGVLPTTSPLIAPRSVRKWTGKTTSEFAKAGKSEKKNARGAVKSKKNNKRELNGRLKNGMRL
jgi:hypothetical protein